MSLYIRLLRLQINQRMGISAIRSGLRDDRKRTLRGLLVLLVAVVGVGVLEGFYIWLLNAFLPGFRAMGMEGMLLSVALLISMVLTFFLGLFYLIGMLFFARDTAFLAALPIPQRTVFAAKFSQVLFAEIATGLLLLAPPFILYGIDSAAGISYWLSALFVALTAPAIPLALAGLLSLLLMRFTAFWKRRDLITIIGSVILLVGFYAGQTYLTSRLPTDMTQEAIAAIVSDASGLISRVGAAFPPSAWAARGMTDRPVMLLVYLAVSVAALGVVVLAAGRLYYGGAMAQLETISKGKAVRVSGKNTQKRGAVFALFLREWRTTLRSPIYALNGLLGIIMGPILMVMMSFGSMGGDTAATLSLLTGAMDTPTLMLLLTAFILFIGTFDIAATTSLSREGKQFFLSRLIPVPPARQALSKLLFGLSVSVLTGVLMCAAAMLLLRVSWQIALAAFALAMLATPAPLALSMLPDILRPKLSWNNETEAIKQNMNGFIGVMLGMAYVVVLGVLSFIAYQVGLSMPLVIGIVVALSLALGVAAVYWLCRAAERSYRRIEG